MITNILLTIFLTAAAPPSFEARTLDGRTLSGAVVELTADRLTLDTGKERVTLETEKLLTLAAKPESKPSPQFSGVAVEIMDGSILQGRQYVVRGSQAQITTAGGEVLAAPTDAIRTVRFEPPGESDAEWTRLIGAKTDGDLLIVRVDGTIDSHKGVLHDVTPDVVRFEVDGELLPVKRLKVFGFAYRHAAASESPPAACRLTDSAGSQWSVRSLRLSDKLQWVTPAGLSVVEPLENVVKIDFSYGKLMYLSDLKPDSVVWTPYFNSGKPSSAMRRFYAPRFDRGFDSNTLRLGGVEYRKGLAVTSRTELVYRLPNGFRRFLAVAGIDDAVRPAGKVRLVVRGDDRVLLETVISGGDAPLPIELDVADVRRLTILVDFGDRHAAGDHLLLCSARIVK